MDPATPDRADATGDTPFVPWSLRATQAGATPADADAAIEKLVSLWSGGRLAAAFDANELRRMRPYLQFVRVGAGQRVIRQDEAGDFMLCVLEGSLLVERVPTVGATAKLAEARAGDVLGDMAVLDGGPRFSTCTTRTPCLLAILETDALARLMKDDAHLGLVVLASMARRLSLRLRQVSARLSALLADT